MAIPRDLRDSLLKYQKRRTRSLSQGVPPYAGQCDFVRPVTRVPGGSHPIPEVSVPIQRVYMDDFPVDYVPDIGFMDIPEPDYGPYEASFVQMPKPTPQGFRGLPQDFDLLAVEYDDCLMSPELFEREMRLAGRFEPISLDQMMELNASRDLIEHALNLEEITDRLFSPGDPARETSVPSPVINASDTHLRPPAKVLPGQIDYAAVDPHDFFEQQIQMIESQLSQFDPGAQMEAVFNVQESLFDLLQQSPLPIDPAMIGPAVMQGPTSLDDIIEAHDITQKASSPGYGPDVPAYDDCLMTQELFEQQMHEAAEGMAPQDAAPHPYDSGMMQEDMYEQPMPEDMMEPEMMDPEMMDPDMMPGPMGPNFMPEPPPGP